jgi:hypothetical protein
MIDKSISVSIMEAGNNQPDNLFCLSSKKDVEDEESASAISNEP